MSYGNQARSARQTQIAVDELKESPGLPFQDLLGVDQVVAALAQAGMAFRQRIFDPVTVLWAWLSQVLSADGSCQEAVHRINAQRVAHARRAASSDTSSYCGARQRLPQSVVRDLTRQMGGALHARADRSWLWHGRPVKLVDGSTLSMPDTAANRRVYSQPSEQKPGLGFPVVRLVVVFSLAVGTVLEMALGPTTGKWSGEHGLFRQMHDALEPGDIVLGDRLYDSYHDIALLQARGVDAVFGANPWRQVDFRRGQVLARRDHVVTWTKPKFDSARFDRDAYDRLTPTLAMRELCIEIAEPGFRTRKMAVVTTLTDGDLFPKAEIATLFRQRWHVELNLRSLKAVLSMNPLRCKSPAMAEKEIWMHLLAYNLIRVKMAQAALTHGCAPTQLSLKGAVQAMRTYGEQLATATLQSTWTLHAAMLDAIAQVRVGNRPDRVEPRALKRRHSKYPYLAKPRKATKPKGVSA